MSGLRNKSRFPDKPRKLFQWFELRPWILCKEFQCIFVMDQSPDIIHIFPADRISGIFLFHHMIHNILEQIIHRKSSHTASVSHNHTHFFIFKSKNILDHLCFIFLEDTFLMCLIHHRDDFFFRNRIFLFPFKEMKNSGKKTLDPVYNLRRPPAGQSTAIVHFVSIPSVICLKSAQLLLKYSTLASVRQG